MLAAGGFLVRASATLLYYSSFRSLEYGQKFMWIHDQLNPDGEFGFIRNRPEYLPLRSAEWFQRLSLVILLAGLVMAVVSLFIHPDKRWGVAGLMVNGVLLLWIYFGLGLL
jgi:hypothetical protein